MGIKFRCPNGHKLNVKSFLAGKRGVCPKCGTSVRIPQATSDESGASPENGDDLLDEARFPAPGRHAALDQGSVATAAAATIPVALPISRSSAAPDSEAGPSADPIAEMPAAIWYVRPPAGGQYGPARGDVMRRWLAEGRVSHDSLVWREDWSDWRAASEVFGLHQSSAPQPPVPPEAAPLPSRPELPAKEEAASDAPRTTRLLHRYEARRRQGSGLGIAAIAFLGLLCIVLAILLVYFVFGFPGGGTKSLPPKPGAASSVK